MLEDVIITMVQESIVVALSVYALHKFHALATDALRIVESAVQSQSTITQAVAVREDAQEKLPQWDPVK